MGKKLATTAPQGRVTAEGGDVARRPRRRWRRRLAVGAAAVLVVSLALYGWAWSSVDAGGHRYRPGPDRQRRGSRDRLPTAAGGAGSAVRTDHAAPPAHDVVGHPLPGDRSPLAVDRRHLHLLRDGPAGGRAQPDPGRASTRAALAVQQLPPAAAGDGAGASHRDVGLGLPGHQAVAATGRRGRRRLEPGLGTLGVREDGGVG